MLRFLILEMKEISMQNCEIVITNNILSDTDNEDELIAIFNEKLATLFLSYEENGKLL